MIVCQSRCLHCGRCTPHEVCHDHAHALHPTETFGIEDEDTARRLWCEGFDKPPEECNDPSCPVWNPGEWDHIQEWANMTPEDRKAETARMMREIGVAALHGHLDRPLAPTPTEWRTRGAGGD